MLMRPKPKSQSTVWTPSPILRILPLAVYFVFVTMVPYTVHTGAFMVAVASIRLLLFSPLLLATITTHESGRHLPAHKAQKNDTLIFAIIAIASAILICLQTLITLTSNDFNFYAVVKAINNDPSLSTLGYDYILSLVSLATWFAMVGNPLR